MPDYSDSDHKEFKDRLEAARRHKDDVRLDLQEAYYFTNPRLARDVSSKTRPSKTKEEDEDTLATDIGSEVSVDFATEIVNGFFPEHIEWVKSKAAEDVSEKDFKAVEKAVRERDATIFRAIRASNFDATLGVSLVPDLSVGTVAMWIDEPNNFDPILCQHIPIRELEINIGPDGEIDDRFWYRYYRGSKIAAVLPDDVTLPDDIAKKLKAKPNDFFPVCWGFWRDWSERGDVKWLWYLTVCDKVVKDGELRGEGSCPLVVWRFMPHALQPWGNGPAISALPMLRVLDSVTACTQDRADTAVDPPFGYPDDGVVNFEMGIEKGHAYPMRPGSGRDFVPLYFEGNPDIGLYQIADMERRIRRQFYADYPQQRGDTPPTATQWVDEMVLSQRRIGTPGKKLWREGPAAVFRRFEWLLKRRAKIADITNEGRTIALVPDNPAARAQEQLDVQIAIRLLEIVKAAFPETSQAAIDELATIEELKRKMGDQVIQLRDKAVVGQLIAGVLQGAQQALEGGGADQA